MRKILTLLLLLGTTSVTTGCELVAAVDRGLIVDGPGERGVLGGYHAPSGTIVGWASDAQSEAPVSVRILVSNEEFVEPADGARQDLVDKELDADGVAGFKLETMGLDDGTVIEAFIVGSELELFGSPCTVGVDCDLPAPGS